MGVIGFRIMIWFLVLMKSIFEDCGCCDIVVYGALFCGEVFGHPFVEGTDVGGVEDGQYILRDCLHHHLCALLGLIAVEVVLFE